MTELKDLTSGEYQAVKRLEAGHWYRVPGGWKVPGQSLIRHGTADSLKLKGIARVEKERGFLRLVLTAYGLQMLDRGRKVSA